MFKNYLTVTFRNLLKNRLFTLINITGLGIALSVCIVAFFNHMFDHEFDRTHENFDEIYRVTCFRDMEGREQEYGSIPATLGLMAKKDIPGIVNSARLQRAGSNVKIGVDIYNAQISFVDPEFLEIFTFAEVIGSIRSIDDHSSVLISRSMAETLFGEDHPVGKTLALMNEGNDEFTYTVGAVFEDLPENSSFRIDIMSHYDNFIRMWELNDADWRFLTHAFFIRVPDRSVIPAVNASLKTYVAVQNRAREDFRINRFNIVPLRDVGANTREIWSSALFPSFHPAALIAPPIMALFILLIACFNFANTSIATFSKRLKEIGLRKTFGGQRRQLVTQFMVETLIICLLALLAGIAFAKYLVPAYSSLWAYMDIELTLTEYPVFWIFLILLVLMTGFVAGVYPALHVSAFSPVNVLKGTNTFSRSGKLASILLTLQFSISVMALVMGIVFAKNARYQETLDLGYDKNKLIAVPVVPELFTSFRNTILNNPKIISAEGTQQHIGWGSYRRPVKYQQTQLEVDVLNIGPEYASTMGLRLVEGRLFDESRSAADRSNGSIIVNRKFVDDFGWKEPVGQTITMYDTTKLTVIGVVEDFYTSGLWEVIDPAMLRLTQNDQYWNLVVRAEPEDRAAVLEYMGAEWKKMGTNYIFRGIVQEDTMQEEKDINSSITKLNLFLAVIATLLSLIGMYNLVSLDVIRRTKEVGIRKIQGAPLPLIVYLLSKKFLVVLAIASLVGSIGGYYMSNMLLDSIWDYFIEIKVGIMFLAALIMISATVLTIVFKVGRAAMRNPVESLRYE
ncbi:MAG: ABC transporter permease [Bacteroidales bacterium]|jgi:ABC-type antimicrobial peptide transport system permease subunit|nr:ABC transporter permease [Bacteroidales bacterium]